MKHESKLNSWMPIAVVGLALSVSVGFGSLPITVNTYDTSTSISGVWDWYGGSTLTWDGTQDHTGNAGGSLHIAKNTSNDHIFDVESYSGNTWDNGTTVWDLTLYTNLSLWLKWDTNSTMGIDTFNTYPAGPGGLTMVLDDNHLGQYDWSGGGLHFLNQVKIPVAASNGWVNLNFPISASIPYINTIGSIVWDAYTAAPWSGTAAFWVDDVVFQPSSVTMLPPPAISGPTKAISGLDIFAASAGINDRHEVLLVQKTGVSWAGPATVTHPVTYSLTIKSIPTNAANYGCEAFLFLIPNPNANDNAGDWNETNAVVVAIQQNSPSNTLMTFQYKVNNDHNNAMYYGNAPYTNAPGSYSGTLPPPPTWFESGNLGSVTNLGSPLGTWALKFTSPTNVTLFTPLGSSNSLAIPPYNGSYFQEVSGYNIYLGMQPNNASNLNQAVVYSSFSISNSLTAPFATNVTPTTDNFVTDLALNTNWWDTTEGASPTATLVVPASAAYWLNWTLPAPGFSLQTGASLTNLPAWTSPGIYPVITFQGYLGQLVDSTELPAGKTAFFNLIKRVASQLQVLLPGETNVPGPGTGKTGTPTPVTLGADQGYEYVTVNACDSTWHIVAGVGGSIDLTATDPSSVAPNDEAMVNGTVTFTSPMLFNTLGTWTISATNTGFTFPTATSSPVNVTP
jgi:hypothetical protein